MVAYAEWKMWPDQHIFYCREWGPRNDWVFVKKKQIKQIQILVLWATHFSAYIMIVREIMRLLWTWYSTADMNSCHSILVHPQIYGFILISIKDKLPWKIWRKKIYADK